MKNKFALVVLLLSILHYLLSHFIYVPFISNLIIGSSRVFLVYIVTSVFLMYLSDRRKENKYLRILNIIFVLYTLFIGVGSFILGGGF